VILWVAAALAFLAEWSAPGQGMAKVGYAIVVVILVSGVFSFWQEYRVERTLAALRRFLPRRADVLREGAAVQLPIEQLVPGDIVLLEQGDHIPADCRLTEAFSVLVDNAVITGESLSKARQAGPCPADDLLHSRNILLAGTSMVSGQAKAVVFATGMQTEFGKIARLTGTTGRTVSPLLEEIGAGRAAPDDDVGPRARHPAHGQTKRSHSPPAIRRDPRIHDRDLHRQDGNADPEPHAGEATLPGRAAILV
jgi:magnesium-transporting ATPase (P-type)